MRLLFLAHAAFPQSDASPHLSHTGKVDGRARCALPSSRMMEAQVVSALSGNELFCEMSDGVVLQEPGRDGKLVPYQR